MKNTLGDLSLHLFETLERLNDDSLSPEELEKEINRANAISNVSDQIIKTAQVVIKARDTFGCTEDLPPMLGAGK